MATARIFIIITCLSSVAYGIRVNNGTNSKKLAARERARRLIPYMTFYLAQPIDQSLTSQANPPTGYAQILEPPPQKDRGWPYPPAQPPPLDQPQYLVPPQQQYHPPYETRYIQQPSPLTKMVTQNYLSITKQQGKLHSQLDPYQHHQSYLGPYSQNEEHLRNNADVYDVHSPASMQYQYRPPPVSQDHTQYKLEPQYKPQEVQYRPEVVLQYQTPAPIKPRFQYKSQPAYKKPVPVKQHLTEITRPIQRLNLYLTKEEPRGFSLSNKPSHFQTTEPVVSIMQSQEIEVAPESSTLQTPIATIAPKYRPTVTLEAGPKYHAVYVARPTTTPPEPVTQELREQYEYDGSEDQNVNNILEGGVSLSRTLPDRITPENLDSSIKTLSKLLKILQSANALPESAKEIVKTFPKPIEPGYATKHVQRIPTKKPVDPDEEEGATPGQAGIDYPVYDEIPQTSFSCKTQRYKGFFGDPDTRCQVWHYCDLNGGQASFLCPNGTIFSQVALTCDWWFNVKCASTAQLYVLNERLYKYILPQKPSFPEDYAGPLVDSYLTHKFREIEQQGRNKTSKEFKEPDPSINDNDHQYSLDDVESENRVRSISNTAVPVLRG